MGRDHHNTRPRFALHRLFTRWVWETNHDDAVPAALAVITPALVLVVMIASYLSPWWVIALALAGVLTLVGVQQKRDGVDVERVRASAGSRSRRALIRGD